MRGMYDMPAFHDQDLSLAFELPDEPSPALPVIRGLVRARVDAFETASNTSDGETTYVANHLLFPRPPRAWFPTTTPSDEELAFLGCSPGGGREGLLVDCGAHDNLGGDRWLERVQAKLTPHGIVCDQQKLERPIPISGVGTNASKATIGAVIPGVVLDTEGKAHRITFETPIVENSDIPALMGHRSLKRNRAILDMINQRLYLCGPGEIQFKPPPGTLCLPLVQSASGHLFAVIDEYVAYGKQRIAEEQSPEAPIRMFPYETVEMNLDSKQPEKSVTIDEDKNVYVTPQDSVVINSSAASAKTKEQAIQADEVEKVWNQQKNLRKPRAGRKVPKE